MVYKATREVVLFPAEYPEENLETDLEKVTAEYFLCLANLHSEEDYLRSGFVTGCMLDDYGGCSAWLSNYAGSSEQLEQVLREKIAQKCGADFDYEFSVARDILLNILKQKGNANQYIEFCREQAEKGDAPSLQKLLDRFSEAGLESNRLHKGQIYSYMLRRRHEDDRVKLWEKSLTPELLEDVPGYDTFTGFFPRPVTDKTGFRLFKDAEREYAGNGRQLDFLVKPVCETKYSEKKLHQAEEIIYEAWQLFDWPKRLYMAYEALRISPYCASAYNLLAARSKYLDEQLMLYQRGARVATLSLGELFFKKYRGHFWSRVESRSYMISLQGEADSLWKQGQRDEATQIYREMLELNPDDNQGIRYLLGFRLLEAGQDCALEALFAEHDEESCFMLYNKALWRFRTGAGDAAEILRRALQENRHVPAYLLGEEGEPYSRPNSYSMGSVEEAVIYVQETKAAWREAAGALDWLQEICASAIASQPLQAANPSIGRVLQDFLE